MLELVGQSEKLFLRSLSKWSAHSNEIEETTKLTKLEASIGPSLRYGFGFMNRFDPFVASPNWIPRYSETSWVPCTFEACPFMTPLDVFTCLTSAKWAVTQLRSRVQEQNKEMSDFVMASNCSEENECWEKRVVDLRHRNSDHGGYIRVLKKFRHLPYDVSANEWIRDRGWEVDLWFLWIWELGSQGRLKYWSNLVELL